MCADISCIDGICMCASQVCLLEVLRGGKLRLCVLWGLRAVESDKRKQTFVTFPPVNANAQNASTDTHYNHYKIVTGLLASHDLAKQNA